MLPQSILKLFRGLFKTKQPTNNLKTKQPKNNLKFGLRIIILTDILDLIKHIDLQQEARMNLKKIKKENQSIRYLVGNQVYSKSEWNNRLNIASFEQKIKIKEIQQRIYSKLISFNNKEQVNLFFQDISNGYYNYFFSAKKIFNINEKYHNQFNKMKKKFNQLDSIIQSIDRKLRDLASRIESFAKCIQSKPKLEGDGCTKLYKYIMSETTEVINVFKEYLPYLKYFKSNSKKIKDIHSKLRTWGSELYELFSPTEDGPNDNQSSINDVDIDDKNKAKKLEKYIYFKQQMKFTETEMKKLSLRYLTAGVNDILNYIFDQIDEYQ